MSNYNLLGQPIDLKEAIEKIDRFDQCVMSVHQTLGEYTHGTTHIERLRRDPKKLGSLLDAFKFSYRKILADKLKKEESEVSEHFRLVAAGTLLSIEYLHEGMIPWIAETTAHLMAVPHWEFDKYVQEHISFRPQYESHRLKIVEQLNYIQGHPNRLNYIAESLGAIEATFYNFLREVEFKSLSFRTLIASFRLSD